MIVPVGKVALTCCPSARLNQLAEDDSFGLFRVQSGWGMLPDSLQLLWRQLVEELKAILPCHWVKESVKQHSSQK
jgi:hypothetical protein